MLLLPLHSFQLCISHLALSVPCISTLSEPPTSVYLGGPPNFDTSGAPVLGLTGINPALGSTGFVTGKAAATELPLEDLSLRALFKPAD